MLMPGKNNAKLGEIVTVKKWAGHYMYALSLEERTTCPNTCEQWDNCYGNNMPFAHRFNHNDNAFLPMLEESVDKVAAKHPDGFVVRLHVLGDFYSPAYIEFWEYLLNTYLQMKVFGYTHRKRISTMGRMIASMNHRMPDRWQVRFSDDPATIFSAHVVQKAVAVNSHTEIVCPEQMGQTDKCTSCGLCWSQPNRRILFVEH